MKTSEHAHPIPQSGGTNPAHEQWSSRFGFLMAAAGSSIGLGNLWKFPYLAGTNGGALFVLIYIVFLILLGMPTLLSEMTIGRFAGRNAVDSCKAIHPKWGFVGLLGVIGSFVILCSYSVVGGWVLKYVLRSAAAPATNANFFASFTKGVIEPNFWAFVFIVLTVVIVSRGVAKGIERISTILLPLLILFLGILMIYGLFQPGSLEGIRYFIVPNFTNIQSAGDVANIALNAMGQVFFSLSLGMGTLITYGSYLPKQSNMVKSTTTIAALDTAVAMMAGFTILPAVFAHGLQPNAGPGLLFETLPIVFSSVAGGQILSFIFFILVLFAALTSSISLLEVIVAWLCDKTKLRRAPASALTGGLVFCISIFASLSFGGHLPMLFGMTFFDALSMLSDKILMPAGAFCICILFGHIMNKKDIYDEISNAGTVKVRAFRLLLFLVRWVTPIFILIIFITSLVF